MTSRTALPSDLPRASSRAALQPASHPLCGRRCAYSSCSLGAFGDAIIPAPRAFVKRARDFPGKPGRRPRRDAGIFPQFSRWDAKSLFSPVRLCYNANGRHKQRRNPHENDWYRGARCARADSAQRRRPGAHCHRRHPGRFRRKRLARAGPRRGGGDRVGAGPHARETMPPWNRLPPTCAQRFRQGRTDGARRASCCRFSAAIAFPCCCAQSPWA